MAATKFATHLARGSEVNLTIYLSALLIGAIGSFIASGLIWLIAAITNLALYQRSEVRCPTGPDCDGSV